MHRKLALALLLVAGCSGQVMSPGGSPGTPNNPSGPGGPVVDEPAQPVSLEQTLPLRRLTAFELDGALGTVLGDVGHDALSLRPEKVRARFETNALEQDWSPEIFERYETVAFDAVERANLDALLGCTPANGQDTCVGDGLAKVMRKAWRRAPTADERAAMQAMVLKLEPDLGLRDSLVRAVQASVLSPEFLYLQSSASAGTADTALSSSELAARLAATLWASGPDDALIAAAEDGRLLTDDGLRAEVTRMLDDPRASRPVSRFLLGWVGALELARMTRTDPLWSPRLVVAYQHEIDGIAAEWLQRGGSLETLLGGMPSFVTRDSAAVYGIGEVGDGLVRVEHPGRGGLLRTGAFLAMYATQSASSPTFRGKWVVTRALCQRMDPPPPGAEAKAPAFVPGWTTRQWHEALEKSEGCSVCHQRMEPPGYVFESFDAIGRARVTEGASMVKTDATLTTGVASVDGPVPDSAGLATKLGQSADVQRCFAQQWLESALGRETTKADREAIDTVASAVAKGAPKEALLALVTSKSFRMTRFTAEVQP